MMMCSENYGILDGRYILECEIGEGATSTVYKAKDSFSDKIYAVKIFKQHSEEFDREMLINKKISESNHHCHFFIHYISFSLKGSLDIDGFTETKCYILYELASKGDLFKYIICPGKGLGEKNCKVLAYKLLNALKILYEIGISHRDLKAENILLDGEKFDLKIADFGSSDFIIGIDGKILQKGKFGTERYMAPEVIKGKRYDGEKADIFSIGVLFFTIIAQKFPFPNAKIVKTGDTIQKKLYSFIKDKDEKQYWETLKEKHIEGFSPEFKDLFLKMVAFEPNERPSINEILKHDWMKEVTILNEKDYKIYEEDLVNALKNIEKNRDD